MKAVASGAIKTGLVAAAVCLSLGLLEGALRLIHYEYTPLRIQVIRKWSEWRYYHAFEDRHFVYDPVLIWRPRKGGEFFNEQGFRGRLLTSSKEPGAARIFAIGDSNTLGWPGPDGPNWPSYLQEILNRNGRPATVINAGVYGYTSFQGLRRFQESLAYDPDMVLISFGCNDAMRVTRSDAEFDARKVRSRHWDQMLMKVRTGQVLLALLDNLPGRQRDRLVPRVSIDEYKANLREIIRVSKARKIKVVLLTRPFSGPVSSPWSWKNFAGDYNAATIQVAREQVVPEVDVYSKFEHCSACFVDEAHFTRDGLKQMAEVIYEAIWHDMSTRAEL